MLPGLGNHQAKTMILSENAVDPVNRVLARAARRQIPVMCLVYVASFLDWVNVDFAALTMNRDLGFSPQI
jgi:ACS family tartrate transporter-like MFS transporter